MYCCTYLLQVVVPFQCSLADASKTVGCLAAQRKHNFAPPAVTAIETSALGESPIVEEPALLLFRFAALLVKRWWCPCESLETYSGVTCIVAFS